LRETKVILEVLTDPLTPTHPLIRLVLALLIFILTLRTSKLGLPVDPCRCIAPTITVGVSGGSSATHPFALEQEAGGEAGKGKEEQDKGDEIGFHGLTSATNF
jgi:hypothetical protein